MGTAAVPKTQKLTATMKAKARIVAQAAAEVRAKASLLDRPPRLAPRRLALKSSKGVGSQPRLARGPDKEGIGFSLVRTLMKPTSLATSEDQPLQPYVLEQPEEVDHLSLGLDGLPE